MLRHFLKSWLSLFLRCVYISTLIKSVYFSASYQGVLHSYDNQCILYYVRVLILINHFMLLLIFLNI